jgi:hypothetical protein
MRHYNGFNKSVGYVSVVDWVVPRLYLCPFCLSVCIMHLKDFYLTVAKSEENATAFLREHGLLDTAEVSICRVNQVRFCLSYIFIVFFFFYIAVFRLFHVDILLLLLLLHYIFQI